MKEEQIVAQLQQELKDKHFTSARYPLCPKYKNYGIMIEWSSGDFTSEVIPAMSAAMAVVLHVADAAVGRMSSPVAVRTFDQLSELYV